MDKQEFILALKDPMMFNIKHVFSRHYSTIIDKVIVKDVTYIILNEGTNKRVFHVDLYGSHTTLQNDIFVSHLTHILNRNTKEEYRVYSGIIEPHGSDWCLNIVVEP